MKLKAIVLDSDDLKGLAAFYVKLLGGELKSCNEAYATVAFPGSDVLYYFQQAEHYTCPVWPEEAARQQQMIHMDYVAEDREQAVRHAVACGATVAPVQFLEDSTVMLDPAGHPFCICTR